MIIMLNYAVVTYAGAHPYEPDVAQIYCELFGDRVAEPVCQLLKKELIAWRRCDVICRGCCRHWLQ